MRLPDDKRETRRGVFLAAGRGAVRLGIAGTAVAAIVQLVRRAPLGRPLEEDATGILRPPGALDEPDFLAACVRCDLCADACASYGSACIRLFGPGEGRASGSPYLVAEVRGCTLCMACTLACPSGALEPLTELTEARMGTAVVDERLCVSHNGTGVCGACHTACPVRSEAITQGIRNAPTVVAEGCVGCGLCEEACIVDDRKAIRVFSGRSWS